MSDTQKQKILSQEKAILLLALANTYPEEAWKTQYTMPGIMMYGDNSFIFGIDTQYGPIWEVLPMTYWDKARIQEVPYRNPGQFNGNYSQLIDAFRA